MRLFMNKNDRIIKIENLGFNPHEVYYHGTNKDIHEFIPSERGALNYGIYMTNRPETANSYASYSSIYNSPVVYPVHLRLKRGLDANSYEKPFTKESILNMLANHPDRNEEGFMGNMRIHAYADGKIYEDPLEHIASKIANKTGLNAINFITDYNLYKTKKQAFEEITKHTGYNHIIQDRGDGEKWISLWHPEDIRSIHANFELPNTTHILESLKSDIIKKVARSITKHYIEKAIKDKKTHLKKKIIDKLSENMLSCVLSDGVNEDAPAANVVANIPTQPIVTLTMTKKELRKKLENKWSDTIDN